MTARTISFLLFLSVVFTGCGVSHYKINLGSRLTRGDGSTLDVQCVSYVKHTMALISPEPDPTPHVKVIMDEKTFTIYDDRILLNGDHYANLLSDDKKVYIEFTKDGFKIEADGEPVTTLLDDPVSAQLRQ